MIAETLTSPIILFFVLGMLAGFARSDLAIPEAIAKGMAIYLMAAIGLKGGASVAASGFTAELGIAAVCGIALSFLIPVPAFALLRGIGRLDRTNAAAVAAHYGSVSLVTFITAMEMLKVEGLVAPTYLVAVLALMETPAIISGLLLARREGGSGRGLAHEVLLNASVVLLIGSFLIGLVAGEDGLKPVKPVFDSGYRGVLCLFLLDMGLIASRRIAESRALNLRLVSLAVVLPLVNGAVGVIVGSLAGLGVPAAAIIGILAASASYIAVPAAMRLALPEADPGIYLSMALGITFPFNIVIGIPLFAGLAIFLG